MTIREQTDKVGHNVFTQTLALNIGGTRILKHNNTITSNIDTEYNSFLGLSLFTDSYHLPSGSYSSFFTLLIPELS